MTQMANSSIFLCKTNILLSLLFIYLLISSFYLHYYSIMVKASASGFVFADYIVFSLPIVDYNSITVYFEGEFSLSVLLLSHVTLIGLFQKKSTPPPPRRKAYFFAPPNPPRFTKLIEPPLPSGIPVRTTVLVSIIASLVQKL